MPVTEIRLRYVHDGSTHGAHPRLLVGDGPEARALEMTDRARWFLAAISLPRELAPAAASDERQRRRLGSGLWSSGEIMARIPYQHRSTIKLALDDLRGLLAPHGLSVEDYVSVDTGRGRYGPRSDRLRVNLLELHAARDAPEHVDDLLGAAGLDRRDARLADICQELVQAPTWSELARVVAASAARARAAGADTRPPPPATSEALPSPAPQPRLAPARRRRAWLTAGGVLGAIVITVIVVLALVPGESRAIHPSGPPRTEVSGGLAHTWSDPRTAGGRQGRSLLAGEAVSVTCRVRGFRVPDGNVWWYLIGGRPWSDHFYATADAFYNDGRTHGSLKGSAFVDDAVAACD